MTVVCVQIPYPSVLPHFFMALFVRNGVPTSKAFRQINKSFTHA